MTTPKLPDPALTMPGLEKHGVYYFTFDQMLAYAAECVAAERERCAALADQAKGHTSARASARAAEWIATAIRAGT
jgi:hypothetical protein